jgi:hypothetical protein
VAPWWLCWLPVVELVVADLLSPHRQPLLLFFIFILKKKLIFGE